jgi:PTS system nitrogen regulatory IIA component
MRASPNGTPMNITDFLSPQHAIVDLRAADKAQLLRELARRAATALGLPADQVSDALLKREALGSTGTGGGIAIPHARLAGVAKPFGMLVSLAKAIDFDAIDGRPVDIVCLLLLPTNSQGEQLNVLACAARTLRDADALRNIRHAGDDAALYRAAAGEAAKPKPA